MYIVQMMEGECILRNRVMHEEQCNEIENAVDKKMHGEVQSNKLIIIMHVRAHTAFQGIWSKF